jgi:hypothetical protein
MIKKYANPHIVYFNSIIILENIIIPSTSLFDGENGGAEFWEGKNYGLTVTVSLSPGGRCVRGANHIKIGSLSFSWKFPTFCEGTFHYYSHCRK